MDLVTQTSLEALLLKATSSTNQNLDTAAVEAFCTLVNKEKDGAHIGVKVIANRLHCGVEKEVLQTLNILDNCMSRCGTHFQSEVGKFRFLNEMIKLVSPKYLGCQTPIIVKQKVLQLLYVWTLDFPKEAKIKEAYEMLRKQGVIREIPNPNVALESSIPVKRVSSIFQDEEKAKILQKLLQSKDPEDIQAANWLIKSMVKEDEKRVELKSKRLSELESAQNNIRLLNEMLDSYIADTTSKDEMDLIKELYQSCEQLRPNLAKLASETNQNEDLLGDIIQINEELTQVFSKYRAIIIGGKSLTNSSTRNNTENDLSLLNFDLMSDGNRSTSMLKNDSKSKTSNSNIDVLCDLFNSSEMKNVEILKPVQLKSPEVVEKTENKFNALEELDILGQNLLKENLSADRRKLMQNKSQEKLPMNLLSKKCETRQESPKNNESDSLDIDLNLLIKSQMKLAETSENFPNGNMDDSLVDITTDDKLLGNVEETSYNGTENHQEMVVSVEKPMEKSRVDIMKLKDIFVDLKDVTPSEVSPVTMIDKNDVIVTLHHSEFRPREDVRVFVVTMVNRNKMALGDYLLQGVVPKSCKLKLQPPSTSSLPAFNPFLPPSALTQIILVSNPDNVKLSLKFVLSYSMDDETVTEIGEVEDL